MRSQNEKTPLNIILFASDEMFPENEKHKIFPT